MPNTYVVQRLAGIQAILMGVHSASVPMSSSSRGAEREAFVERFLGDVLPPIYRFGSGDATDANGHRSGQLDVVVEYPVAPSLPGVSGPQATRLYLAESIAAVIEVKSDVSRQWSEVLKTASQLSPLKRSFGATMTMGGFALSETVPLFVASYVGWKNLDTLKVNLSKATEVAGVLVIDQGLFVSSPSYGGIEATGPLALWGLISVLHLITNALQAASTNPLPYGQ